MALAYARNKERFLWDKTIDYSSSDYESSDSDSVVVVKKTADNGFLKMTSAYNQTEEFDSDGDSSYRGEDSASSDSASDRNTEPLAVAVQKSNSSICKAEPKVFEDLNGQNLLLELKVIIRIFFPST